MTDYLPIDWHENTSAAVGEQHIVFDVFAVDARHQDTVLAVLSDGDIFAAVLLDAEQGANLQISIWHLLSPKHRAVPSRALYYYKILDNPLQ